MKKRLLYLISVFGLLTIGCSKDNIDQGNGLDSGEKHSFTITGVMVDDNASTRVSQEHEWESSPLSSATNTRISSDEKTGITTWSLGASVDLLLSEHEFDTHEGYPVRFEAIELSDNKKTAILKGGAFITNPKMAYGIHPATGKYGVEGLKYYELKPITTQDNTLQKMAMVAYPTEITTTTIYGMTTIENHIRFTHLYAAIGVKLQLPAGINGTIESVSISSSHEEQIFATKIGAMVDILAEEWNEHYFANLQTYHLQHGDKKAVIKIVPQTPITTSGEGIFDIYSKIYPTNRYGTGLEEMIFNVKLTDGRTYIAKKRSVRFDRGRFYKSTGRPISLEPITNIEFADSKFKEFLIQKDNNNIELTSGGNTIDTNGDNEISTVEALNLLKIKNGFTASGMTSFGGLEYFKNLTEIQLYSAGNSTEALDMSAISELINLEELSCGDSNITSLPNLSKLTKLRTLECYFTKLTSLPDLSTLVNLETLDVEDNDIESLPNLTKSTKLTSLLCAGNMRLNITDFSVFSNLIRLSYSGSGLDKLANTAHLTKLRSLACYESNNSDISAISSLTNLVELTIYANKIVDISPISQLTNLKALDIDENEISDISAIAGLVKLEHLYLDDNKISDISAIANLVNLYELQCRNNKLSKIDVSRIIKLDYFSCANQINNNGNSLELTLTESQKRVYVDNVDNSFDHYWQLNALMTYVTVP